MVRESAFERAVDEDMVHGRTLPKGENRGAELAHNRHYALADRRRIAVATSASAFDVEGVSDQLLDQPENDPMFGGKPGQRQLRLLPRTADFVSDPSGCILGCARLQDARRNELEEDLPHCDPAECLRLTPVQKRLIDVGLLI